jgi:hypothetical protein
VGDGDGGWNLTNNARKHRLMRPASLTRLVPEMVAQPGFEPGTTGYEPVEIPFLYRASTVRPGSWQPRDGTAWLPWGEPGLWSQYWESNPDLPRMKGLPLPLDDTALRWGDRRDSNPLSLGSQPSGAPRCLLPHLVGTECPSTPTRDRTEPPSA